MIRANPLSDQVYNHLLDKIVARELSPGHALHEVELAQRLGVSRTPIREALARLVEDGLVEIQPNRRSLVRRLGPDDMRHIYQVREALEGMAAELACGRFEPEELDALEQMADRAQFNQQRDRAADRQFDRDLHRLIAERSGNPIL